MNNLPLQPTPFVGRQPELDAIAALLADPACRLLTLVGPGGMGKTRLSLEVGRMVSDGHTDYCPDNVCFVPLQPVMSADFIPSAIASLLDIPFYQGGDPLEQVLYYLSDKHLLLILDNFEHLLDGLPLLSAILARAPEVKVLATSREAFNLQEEWLYAVEGMRFPESTNTDDCEDFSAVRLFTQHARRIRPDFDLEGEREGVVRICRLVEGMPLALELAAVWVRTLSCAEIADEIERGLDILDTPTRNMPERHRNMRVMLEQSWKQLSEAERTVFKKLSVFQGGFTRAAAEVAAGASVRMLSALVNKSLLRRGSNGRYDMHELLRQYAAEQLDPAASQAVRDLHAAYYAGFLAHHWDTLRSQEQAGALQAITQEIENIRAAWYYMIEQQKFAELAQAIYALWYYLLVSYREKDGLEMFGKALDMLRSAPKVAEAQRLLGIVLIFLGDLYDESFHDQEARTPLEEGMALLQVHGTDEDRLQAQNSMVHFLVGEYGWSRNIGTQAVKAETVRMADENLKLARAKGNPWWIAECLYSRALLAMSDEKYEDARCWGEESLKVAQTCGDLGLIGLLAGPFLGRLLELLGVYDEAKELRLYSNRVYSEGGHQFQRGWNYQGIGYIAFLQKSYDEARLNYQQSLKIYLGMCGHPNRTEQLIQSLFNVGKLWAAEGHLERAVTLFSAIFCHPQAMERVHDWSNEEMGLLREKLSADRYSAAFEAGKTLDIETTAEAFLAEQTASGTAARQPDGLTDREHEILQLAADGLSNREIADRLIFSVGTVKWYMNQIYSKLGVGSRTQAVARARAKQLLN